MRIDIRKWIMALAVVPLTVASVSLSWLFTRDQIEQLHEAFNARSANLAIQLAYNSEYGVLADNKSYLDHLLTTAVSASDVVAASILSEDKSMLLSSGTPAIPNKQYKLTNHLSRWSDGNRQYIAAPIIGSRIELDDNYLRELTGSENGEKQSGWVLIEMTMQSISLQKEQIITRALITTLVLMSITLMLAVWLSRRILRPITELSSAVTTLAQGQLNTRVANRSMGELGVLERGFNEMAQTLEHSHRIMQQQISAATSNLQRAYSQLEKQNQALELANYRANSASEAKSRFLANMSHELRTPVSSIIGFCRLLLKLESDDSLRSQITFIERSANNLLGIINEVLEFSSMESGEIQLKPATFNLREALHDVIYLMRPSAHEKDLTLSCMVYDDVPGRIITDVYRLKQILTNLIGNAIKFTSQGAIDIRCMILDEEENELTLCISIHDSGIGIPADKLNNLFQPFDQIDNSNSRRYGGAGLGLTISRDLVQLMGGTITVTSNAEEGSTFEVCWPVQAVEAVEDTAPLSGIHIELYDNIEFSKTTLRHTLSSLGAHCTIMSPLHATTGLRGETTHTVRVISLTQAAIAQGELDAILKQAHLPTLLLANSSDPETLQRLQSAGVDYCLPRPAHPQELVIAFAKLGLIDPLPDADTATDSQPTVLGTPSILVAEDATINRELIRAQLQHLGIEAKLVSDGQAAVTAAEQQSFDLIIMDLHMPIMDGTTASRLIRQSGKNTQTPIIALTADFTVTQHADLSQFGIQEVIAKPLSDEDLLRLLQHPGPAQKPTLSTNNLDTGTDKMDNSTMVIDTAFLLKQSRGNTSFVQQTLNMLQKELISRQPELARLIEAESWEELRQIIHKIHGAASYCGTQPLKQAAHDMESALIEQRIDDIGPHWQTLNQRINEVISAIEQTVLEEKP